MQQAVCNQLQLCCEFVQYIVHFLRVSNLYWLTWLRFHEICTIYMKIWNWGIKYFEFETKYNKLSVQWIYVSVWIHNCRVNICIRLWNAYCKWICQRNLFHWFNRLRYALDQMKNRSFGNFSSQHKFREFNQMRSNAWLHFSVELGPYSMYNTQTYCYVCRLWNHTYFFLAWNRLAIILFMMFSFQIVGGKIQKLYCISISVILLNLQLHLCNNYTV